MNKNYNPDIKEIESIAYILYQKIRKLKTKEGGNNGSRRL